MQELISEFEEFKGIGKHVEYSINVIPEVAKQLKTYKAVFSKSVFYYKDEPKKRKFVNIKNSKVVVSKNNPYVSSSRAQKRKLRSEAFIRRLTKKKKSNNINFNSCSSNKLIIPNDIKD